MIRAQASAGSPVRAVESANGSIPMETETALAFRRLTRLLGHVPFRWKRDMLQW